jgi:FHS family L-fucose permease-like MFS transporter
VLGASGETAGLLLGLYWGGAMVGRFAGGALLLRLRADGLLAGAASVAALLCLLEASFADALGSAGLGALAGAAALAIGLFNSVQFPSIFALTLERSRAPAPAVSGLLCMAIAGGAVIPPLMGLAADRLGPGLAFAVPAACYAYTVGFAAAPNAQSALAPVLPLVGPRGARPRAGGKGVKAAARWG